MLCEQCRNMPALQIPNLSDTFDGNLRAILQFPSVHGARTSLLYYVLFAEI
jgi:hypothetical protein